MVINECICKCMMLYDGIWMHMKVYLCIWVNMMVLGEYLIINECKW